MRIAMISTYDATGGAGRAAFRLFKGLTGAGTDAAMLVQEKTSDDPRIYRVHNETIDFVRQKKVFSFIQRRAIDLNRTDRSDTWFSLPYPGIDLSDTPCVRNSDILNLHWVSGFQSVETVALLLQTGKPVVWTLHDQNPFTGGCHYSGGCEKYREDCRGCPQLRDDRFELPYHVVQNKRHLLKGRLSIVTPSRWLAACAEKSSVFADKRVEVIPYAVETDVFAAKPKEESKRALGIPPDTLLLLFGCDYHKESRKGFAELVKIFGLCRQNPAFQEMLAGGKIRIATFGHAMHSVRGAGDFGASHFGFVDDDEELARIYSAADVYLLPSKEDNLPNNLLEAMACGTPVVGFRVGGIPDVVREGITGHMAPPFDCRRFSELVLDLVFDGGKRERFGASCREDMERRFSLGRQSDQYRKLFSELLEKREAKETIVAGKGRPEESGSRDIALGHGAIPVHGRMNSIYRRFAGRTLFPISAYYVAEERARRVVGGILRRLQLR